MDAKDWIEAVKILLAAAGAGFALYQYRLSTRLKKAEWIESLHAKFFESANYKRIRGILDHEKSADYADLIYNGLWFTAHHQDLAAYVASTQRFVTGTVRMRLHKGQAVTVGRKSPRSLYSYVLATYDRGDQFDHNSAKGFIDIWSLPVQQQAHEQLLADGEKPFQLGSPPAPEGDDA